MSENKSSKVERDYFDYVHRGSDRLEELICRIVGFPFYLIGRL